MVLAILESRFQRASAWHSHIRHGCNTYLLRNMYTAHMDKAEGGVHKGGRWGWQGWGEWWGKTETTVLEQQQQQQKSGGWVGEIAQSLKL